MLGPREAFRYDLARQQIDPTPTSTTGAFDMGYPGATVTVSANGNRNGIVWLVRNDGPYSDLRAYDATNLTKELYSSEMSPQRDRSGPSVIFGVPTVADGSVFVGDGVSWTYTGCCRDNLWFSTDPGRQPQVKCGRNCAVSAHLFPSQASHFAGDNTGCRVVQL